MDIAIDRAGRLLAQRADVMAVCVFGSAARPEPRREPADLDLAVVFEDANEPAPLASLLRLAGAVERDCGVPVATPGPVLVALLPTAR